MFSAAFTQIAQDFRKFNKSLQENDMGRVWWLEEKLKIEKLRHRCYSNLHDPTYVSVAQ